MGDMEHNGGNQNMALATLCRNGCGFYGNSSFDGMCSKCYKDMMKRRQQNTSPTQTQVPTAGRISPADRQLYASASAAIAEAVSSSSETAPTSTSSTSLLSVTSTSSTSGTMVTSTTPSVDTATPTVPSTSSDKSQDKEEATGGAEVASDNKDKESSEKDKKPKKSRCHTCKKKTGLTGFQCRCGGLYCGLHRYSDKHNCTFNYKEMAQEQIRKNNPVVIGQKIQKI